MHSESYTIIIKKPISEVFATSLNPKNTSLWVDGIVEEQANESPAKLGTIYRNRGESGEWAEYVITEYELNKVFTLSRKDGAFHVRYVFKSTGENETEFTYSEWEDKGELRNPLPEAAIRKLKEVIESQ